MSLTVDEINIVIEKVQRQLSAFNKALELICVIHKTGTRKNACMSLKKGYMGEEISPSLNKLLSAWTQNDMNDAESEFLGTIETYKSNLGGLVKKNLFINILAINTDNYHNETDLEFDLYRMAWNACNALKNATNSKNKEAKNRILVPSPKGLRKLGNNLQADIFGALTYSLMNKVDYVSELANKRAQMVIRSDKSCRPEYYPYLMTLDQTKYMFNQLHNKRKLTSNIIEQVWAASKIIIQTMNENKLATWEKFSTYAQDMAWRGFSGEIILSIAIDRNDDIETKKLGVQVSGLTGTNPVSPDESSGYYNPFKTDMENAEIHSSFIEELFENLLTRSIFENSSLPFREKADEQNKKLKKGQFMGWCASALHDAADVFDKSLKAKQPPTMTTREIFKSSLNKVTLIKLKALGEEILQFKKEHGQFSDRDFIELLKANYTHKLISDSVLRSMRKNTISTTEEDQKIALSAENKGSEDEIYGPATHEKEEVVTRH